MCIRSGGGSFFNNSHCIGNIILIFDQQQLNFKLSKHSWNKCKSRECDKV